MHLTSVWKLYAVPQGCEVFLVLRGSLGCSTHNLKTSGYSLLNEKIKSAAYEYLLTKQGSKGYEVKHTELKMSNYLSPTSRELSTDGKCKVFEMRNKMTRIPANFSSRTTKNICFCGNDESMEHIYTCKILDCDIPSTKYENIYTDNVKLIYKVYI